DSPAAVPLLEEIEEAASAHDVGEDAVDEGALIDGHLDLRRCARSGDVAGEPAQKVEDIDAAIEAFPADFDELPRRTLKPCGRHPSVLMPDSGEPFPVARVAPQHPV